jgi:polyisoprenoid-binding protein YceI
MFQKLTHAVAHTLVLIAAIVCSIGSIGSATAQETLAWQIHQPSSSITFNTTKSGAAGVGGVTETMRFKSFKGGLSSKGQIELTIDLSSVDSGIAIRDERLQNMFWNVAAHPSVSFVGQLSAEDIKNIAAGKASNAVMVEGQLTMAGQAKPIKAALQVIPAQHKLYVSTRQPIVINANDFGLNAGVEALRTIVGLNYLSTSAPVTFALELNMASSAKTMSESKLPPSAW